MSLKSSPYRIPAGAFIRRPRAHTGAPTGPADFSACCVSATALQQPRQASPERVGEYSQTQVFYRALWKSVKQKKFRTWFFVLFAYLCENSAGFPGDHTMTKRLLTMSFCLLALTLSAQTKKSPMKKSAGAAPDKAYLQKIWDGWSTLDPANTAKFYATGPHTFFDIAPLKYDSWDQYEKGVKGVLSGYKSAKFTVNDDAAIHPHGDLVWATATVKEEMTT